VGGGGGKEEKKSSDFDASIPVSRIDNGCERENIAACVSMCVDSKYDIASADRSRVPTKPTRGCLVSLRVAFDSKSRSRYGREKRTRERRKNLRLAASSWRRFGLASRNANGASQQLGGLRRGPDVIMGREDPIEFY